MLNRILNLSIKILLALIIFSLVIVGIFRYLRPPDYLPLDNPPDTGFPLEEKHTPRSSAFDSLSICEQLEKWRKSQETGDISLYLSIYSVVKFKRGNMDFGVWKEVKSRQFQVSRKTEVRIGSVGLRVYPERAVTRFVQTTQEGPDGSGKDENKIMFWVREEQQGVPVWRIYKEMTADEKEKESHD